MQLLKKKKNEEDNNEYRIPTYYNYLFPFVQLLVVQHTYIGYINIIMCLKIYYIFPIQNQNYCEIVYNTNI